MASAVPAKRRNWTEEEDKLLVSQVEACGVGKWVDVAKGIPGRDGKSCRGRWANHLNPEVVEVQTIPFTEKEDEIIIAEQAVLGNKWAVIATKLRGRTDNAIKNRWNGRLKELVASLAQQAPAAAAAAWTQLVPRRRHGDENAAPANQQRAPAAKRSREESEDGAAAQPSTRYDQENARPAMGLHGPRVALAPLALHPNRQAPGAKEPAAKRSRREAPAAAAATTAQLLQLQPVRRGLFEGECAQAACGGAPCCPDMAEILAVLADLEAAAPALPCLPELAGLGCSGFGSEQSSAMEAEVDAFDRVLEGIAASRAANPAAAAAEDAALDAAAAAVYDVGFDFDDIESLLF